MIDPKKEALQRMKRAEKLLYTIQDEIGSAQALLSVLVGGGKAYEWLGKIREDVKKTIYAIQADMEGDKCILEEGTVAVLEKYEANQKKARNLKLKGKPKGRYSVRLRSVGNPDFGQYAPLSEPQEVVADTLRELWKQCEAYIDKWSLGGGNWTNPRVKENGKPIGYFSYNGRLWSLIKQGVEIEYGVR